MPMIRGQDRAIIWFCAEVQACRNRLVDINAQFLQAHNMYYLEAAGILMFCRTELFLLMLQHVPLTPSKVPISWLFCI